MAHSKGNFSFPGLANVRKASYTLTHGVTPSVALVEIIPQVINNIHGAMQFSYNNTVLVFPAAKIIEATVRKTGTGWVQLVKIADRRWMFTETGEISGVFNQRLEDESIRISTLQTPQQIAALCFQAMQQFVFSFSELPNLSRPEMILENENPAQVLSDLAEKLGCRVVLGTDNVLRIRRIGIGAALPTPGIMSPSFSVQVPDIPDSVKLVGGKTRVQSRWDTEAVGEDTDGSIKPIDDLSYKPAKGWNQAWIGNYPSVLEEFGKKSHALAKKSVHRWYRITNTDVNGRIARKDVLPIETGLIDTYEEINGEVRGEGAVVRGVYWLKPNQIILLTTNSSKTDSYDEPFTINAKEGIVQFGEAVVKATQNGNKIDTDPAELTLEVAYSVQNSGTKSWIRFETQSIVASPARGTGPLILKQDDIVQTFKVSYDDTGNITGVADNISAVQQNANNIINAKLQEFQSPQAFTADYAGIFNISPDGAIRQVSWEVVHGVGSITRAGLNTEIDRSIPRFKAAREQEKQGEIQKKVQRLDMFDRVKDRRGSP